MGKKAANVSLERLSLQEGSAEYRSLDLFLRPKMDSDAAKRESFPSTIGDDAIFYSIQDFPADFQRSAGCAAPENLVNPFLDLMFRPQKGVQETHMVPL